MWISCIDLQIHKVFAKLTDSSSAYLQSKHPVYYLGQPKHLITISKITPSDSICNGQTYAGSLYVRVPLALPWPLWLSWLSRNTNAVSGVSIPHPGS